ncbi:aldehyde dehydrogenase (NADP(+)) [Cryobacterium luteum]|uniref:Aldehyde dehydrogenase (NADP(+)) n=1 Tax=Cryobacterium luteum TaxID=1424661 RepID=A0A1H8BY54_9MICO|nr:aldehyde dehydrogenase (NADP(+)) [Cryobacterium luteum]TFB89175.1 aldehyde dehydrogenase (NADP(+)) [Cryobacterium luteum]SEM87703.1 NADP-dependent aldehyde dehydrogenase [Cryobacterium luteum]
MTVPTGTTVTTVTTDLTGSCLIGGAAVRGTHGEVSGVNPVTGETLAPSYGLVGIDEVDHAAELAWTAFASYRKTSPAARAAFLETIADNIAALGSALTDRVIAETGLPLPRVLGETGRTVGQLRLFAAVLREGNFHGARIDAAQPDRTPLPRPDIRLQSIALGPVAVFGASNFPLAFSVAGGDTASALAAGCPVIVKAHSAHPGTSELIGGAIRAAVVHHDLPEGVFSLLYGSGAVVGTALVTHPRIKAVGFTGSRGGGLALVTAAANRPEPIPVYAEMSSINPVFVLPGALAHNAAGLGEQWVASVVTGTGQLCTSPGLVFVPEGPAGQAFTAAATAAVQKLSATPMLTAGIRDAFDRGATRFREHAGVRNLTDRVSDSALVVGAAPQLFATDAAIFLADPALQEEVFGPASLVVTVRDTAQMVQILAGLEGQLTVTLHTDADEPGCAELLDAAELRAGRVLFNGWPTGVEVVSAMVHGGPFPATSNAQGTSVGTLAIDRFLRPVSYQNVPAALLSEALQDDNPLGIVRQHNGQFARE